MKYLVCVLLISISTFVFSQDCEERESVFNEYKDLRNKVEMLSADRMIGSFFKVKNIDSYLLIWSLDPDLNRHEMLRYYSKDKNNDSFAVTYHRSSSIIKNRFVIRRFIQSGTYWVNHTIDYESGEFIGSQGSLPKFTEEQKNLLARWNICWKDNSKSHL